MKVEYDLPEALAILIMNQSRQLAITESDYVHSALVAFSTSQNKTLLRISDEPSPVDESRVPTDPPTGVALLNGTETLTENELDILVNFSLTKLLAVGAQYGDQQFFTVADLVGHDRWRNYTYVTRSDLGREFYNKARKDPLIGVTAHDRSNPRKYFVASRFPAAAPIETGS